LAWDNRCFDRIYSGIVIWRIAHRNLSNAGVSHSAAPGRQEHLVASSATTTPITASPSALTSAPSTAVAATTATAFTWPGFIDYHIAAHEILAVEGLDYAGRFFVVIDFNEAETTRLSSFVVLDYAHSRSRCTRLCEPIAYILFRSLEW
jgi:hypothetical protein